MVSARMRRRSACASSSSLRAVPSASSSIPVSHSAQPVTFPSQDPYGAALPADYTFQPTDQGLAFFPAGAALFPAGVWDVTATDTAAGQTGSDFVAVTPAPAVAFQVIAPADATLGAPFDVTVIAVEYLGVGRPKRGLALATSASRAAVRRPATVRGRGAWAGPGEQASSQSS